MFIAFMLQLSCPAGRSVFTDCAGERVFMFGIYRDTVWLATGEGNAARLDPVDALARR